MVSRFFCLTLAGLVPFIAAHGSFSGAFIDGVYVPGPEPNSGSTGFAIREINDIDPVKGTSNPDINCGHGAQKASKVVEANLGSVVKFAWKNGEGGPWVHNTGPVMTYMASCGSGGCVNFDSANAEFFKISELGKKDDGTWYMSDLNAGLNATTSATIPTNLAAGEYLIRHELIALQLGMTEGGAEFYPACIQVRIANSANSTTIASASLPSSADTVTFPGGYNDSDPGIFDPNVYDPGSPYTFPGPPLVNAAVPNPSGSASPSDVPANTSSNNGTPTSSSHGTTASPVPTGSGCGYSKKKKRVVKRVFRRNPLVRKSVTPVNKREATHVQPDYKRSNHAQPVVRSRMMRGI